MLSLVGVEADPVRDPRHIVLARLLEVAWEKGEDLELEDLITQLVDPPFKKVGVFPLDTFFGPDDRMKLARSLNGVLASPSFEPWRQGPTLDLKGMTQKSEGRVPVSLFYLAHLSDSERMFFTSLLLERVLAWSRTLPGSSNLRALIYFDEVAGYLPPHPADPPSKKPLLTLMKQARAVGVGAMLATQNPVDIDYKAVSNAGTWMIGRLQTPQDRERVMDGLMAATGGVDRSTLDGYFGQLKPRVFLMKQANEDVPQLYHTRWAMAYLRGPLTRAELEKLPQTRAQRASSEPTSRACSAPPEGGSPRVPPVPQGYHCLFLDPNAVFSARLEGFFEDAAEPRRPDGKLFYRPALHAEVQLRFDERAGGFNLDEHHHRLFFPLDKGLPARSRRLLVDNTELLKEPHPEGLFAPLPDFLDEEHELKAARKEMVEELYRNVTRGQWLNPKLKLYGREGESREEFEARCRGLVDDEVDARVAKLRDRYDGKVKRLEAKIARQHQTIERLSQEATGRKAENLLSVGKMVMSLFTKRRPPSVTAAVGRFRRAGGAELRVEHAEEKLAGLQQEVLELQQELEDEVVAIEEKELKALEATEEREVRLDKNDIRVVNFGILWIPVSRRI